MLIQLDFDGTVVEFDWPKIGLFRGCRVNGCFFFCDKFKTKSMNKHFRFYM